MLSPQDAAEQHARKAHVLDVSRARQLRQQVDPAYPRPIIRCTDERRRFEIERRDRKIDRARQIPVAQPLVASLAAEDAVVDRDIVRPHAHRLGRRIVEQGSHQRAGSAHRRRTLFRRETPGRIALIRGTQRIRRNHPHDIERHAQFRRRDHGHHRRDPLPQLDLARANGDPSGRLDLDPPVEARVCAKGVRMLAHGRPAPPDCLASSARTRSIALMMRTCAPQRQMWRSSSTCRIALRSRVSGSATSAATLITIPLTQ
jgi:hypothetical protein